MSAGAHAIAGAVGRRLLPVILAVLTASMLTAGAATSAQGSSTGRRSPEGAVAAGACALTAASTPDRAASACEEQVAQQVAIRVAWEWVLCWDEGAACDERIERQHPGWEAWAWVRCTDEVTGVAP